jgi:NADH:ubiquinone oxidoreductase subunit
MARLAASLVRRTARKPPGAAKIWEVDYTPNATGTVAAYRPQGALERGGRRARATGDYEAWTPDA